MMIDDDPAGARVLCQAHRARDLIEVDDPRIEDQRSPGLARVTYEGNVVDVVAGDFDRGTTDVHQEVDALDVVDGGDQRDAELLAQPEQTPVSVERDDLALDQLTVIFRLHAGGVSILVDQRRFQTDVGVVQDLRLEHRRAGIDGGREIRFGERDVLVEERADLRHEHRSSPDRRGAPRAHASGSSHTGWRSLHWPPSFVHRCGDRNVSHSSKKRSGSMPM